MAIMTTLDFTHAKNHSGRMFNAAAIASGSTAATVFIAPATGTDLHAVISLYTSAATTYRIYEDVANVASSGSALTPVCRNRCANEKRAPRATFRTGVTLNASGATALTPIMFVGAGTGPQAAGGAATDRNEWVFEGGKKYHIATGTASANKNIIIDFYEVPSVA